MSSRIAIVASSVCLMLAARMVFAQSPSGPDRAPPSTQFATAAPVLWQPSMNVFRRFAVEPEKMYEFYGDVLGFEQLQTLNVGAGNSGGVARFRAGAQELKLTRRT